MKAVKENIVNIKVVGMLGLGNFFMVVDNREQKSDLSLLLKHLPVWKVNQCEQFIILENSEQADVFMRIYNKDGGEVEACGNASRCIAGLLLSRLLR